MKLSRTACIVSGLLMLSTAWAEFRIWTGENGSVVEAEMISVANGKISLKKRDGNVIRIPVSKLCPEDRAYISGDEKKEDPVQALPMEPIVHLSFDKEGALGQNVAQKQRFGTRQLKWAADGRKGGAAAFNGKNSGLMLNRPQPMSNEPFSIAVWFKTECDDYQQIFSYGANIKGCCLYTDGNKVGAVYRWKSGAHFKEFSSSKLKAKSGKWNHVCLTIARDGTGTLYGNGKKLIARQVTMITQEPSSVAVLGLPSPVYEKSEQIEHFSGMLDEFLWFDAALSAAQVQQLYDSYP